MHFFNDNSESIGHTPLVKLKNFGSNNIFAKVESRNPSFSIKCRIGANMVWQAEKDGILTKDKHIIDATSGNTGVALAYVAAARGYPITITMPESMSLERKKLLKGLGANLVLTPADQGMNGAIKKAEEITASRPDYYVRLNQFENPANPAIHRSMTAVEIDESLDGKVDMIVAGVGTGGTISGISQYFKLDKKQDLISVAVEPKESPVITQFLAGQELKAGKHKIQGIGAGMIPKNLATDLIDLVEQVDSETAIKYAKEVMLKEGILVGISSGAALAAADKLGKLEQYKGKNIVVIFPSAAERYLSTDLYADITF